MAKNIGHRFFDAPEAVCYGVITVTGACVTTALATATVALAMTGIGIPVAFLTGAMTLGSAAGTTYTGSKTAHKTSHVFGREGDCHSLSHAKAVLTCFS
jgi:hypothetical protein